MVRIPLACRRHMRHTQLRCYRSGPDGRPEFLLKGSLLTEGPVEGASVEITHAFDRSCSRRYRAICGDDNPIHHDVKYTKSTPFGKPIVHGMLLSSLFSTLFGKAVHGAIYVSQSLNFKAPVYIGSEVTASMEIIDAKVTRKGSLLKCRTVCRVVDTGVIAIDGEAKVLLPPPKIDSDSDVAPQPKRKPRGRPRTKATTTYTKGNLDVDQ